MTLERPRAEDPYAKLPPVPSFSVSSPDVEDGQPLPDSAVGSGGNRSPELSWTDVPEGTESFVVTCFDPDAPTPSGFWHWIVTDIPKDVTSLPAGAGESDATLPEGAFHLRNDPGHQAYDGAAPPEGDVPHRYYFVVHAVRESSLGVDRDASPAVLSFNLAFKTLGRAVLVGTHQA
jgi:Raf kinase inhibitor-like YbhB/YbcL family protein